jgi:DNA-binding IclR family transcriptional regulator
MADISAIDGRHEAPAVAAYLRGEREWPHHLRLGARPPLTWVAPNLLLPSGQPPPRDRFLFRSAEFLRRPRIVVRQGERELWSGRRPGLAPGRSAHIPAGWAAAVDPDGGPVTVSVK